MFNAIGPLELLIIFTIVLMVFGADKLPELARGLGKGIREVRRAANMVRNEIITEADIKVENPLEEELEDIKSAIDPGPILDPNLGGGESTTNSTKEADQEGSTTVKPEKKKAASPRSRNRKLTSDIADDDSSSIAGQRNKG